MGLNKKTKVPCGFCFVEFYDRAQALFAINCADRTMLDGRIIRIDIDRGFTEDRQFGRGKSGGQFRDELRKYDDPERGSWLMNNKSHDRSYSRNNDRHLKKRSGDFGDSEDDRRDFRENPSFHYRKSKKFR